jgi:hypothetical protein
MQKVVTLGEIMLRLATPGYKRFIQSEILISTFGGGEANVAVSLANYGIPVEFVTRLPENDIANWCISDLRKYGVGTRHILRGGERVGIYFLETGAVARPSKVIYDRANSSFAEVEKGMINWKEILKDESWFHWTGITPAISQGAADVCLEAVKTANEMGITVSCDLNYRKNLWRYGKSAAEIMPQLVEGCNIILKQHAGESLYGTSNVYMAYKHNLSVSGTHPHEWVQFHGSIYGYKMANYMSMEDWINVFDGDLGTVLTDTYTTDVFLRNFSKKHAALFTSLRHDSGDPFVFIDKVIRRYEELRINPKMKYLVFSDSLNVDKAIEIKNYCNNRIGSTFGIGTNLTNDVSSKIKSMNIVMKLFRCKMTAKEEWQECVKLSDVEGKHTGSEREIMLVKATLGL